MDVSRIPSWPRSRRAATLIVVVSVAAACGADNGADLDAAEARADETAAQLQTAEAQAEDLAAELQSAEQDAVVAQEERANLESSLEETKSDLQDAVDVANQFDEERLELIEERDQAEKALVEMTEERDAAAVERDAASAAADEMRVRFDPEIQSAIAEAGQIASDTACMAADIAGFDGGSRPDSAAFVEQALTGLPDGVSIDAVAVDGRIQECFEAGEQRRSAEALRQPKGDGLWTVGLEIAAGKWRSAGSGDSCYWQRSPDGQPDDIIDNHFGNAGGSVTLREGEEFETNRCGQWEFAG